MRFSKLIAPAPILMQRARRLSGCNMKEICQRLGFSSKSRSVVYDWERGKHVPTMQSLQKLARAYDCDIGDFYLIDLEQISILSRSVVVGFFNDPESQPDKAAWIAARLLTFYAKREAKQKSPPCVIGSAYDPLKDLVEVKK